MIKYFILILFLFFMIACSEKQESNKQNLNEKKSIEFVLNNGAKWQMDQHTRKAIHNLDSLLKTYKTTNSVQDYNQLAEKLDEELISLIRGCTMEGPAHDQLHVFLGYFYPMVQELKKTKETGVAIKLVNEMKTLFNEYHKYFE